jgi:hypothetical protein
VFDNIYYQITILMTRSRYESVSVSKELYAEFGPSAIHMCVD